MENMEEKLGAILNNPQMMQQIMTMAQTMSQSQQDVPKHTEDPQTAHQPPEIDLSMLSKLSGVAGQSTITKEEKALLCALGPYLSKDRVVKLEKAMRAEKIARLASAFLGQGGLSFLAGR